MQYTEFLFYKRVYLLLLGVLIGAVVPLQVGGKHASPSDVLDLETSRLDMIVVPVPVQIPTSMISEDDELLPDNNLPPLVEVSILDVADGIVDPQELICLAENIYYEARNQGPTGMIAVGYVTKNRVLSPRWDGTYCGVVYDGKKENGEYVLNKCQFSWVCDGRQDVVHNIPKWNEVKDLAEKVITGEVPDPTNKATFYHTTDIEPWWAASPTKLHTVTIKDHKFYRLQPSQV